MLMQVRMMNLVAFQHLNSHSNFLSDYLDRSYRCLQVPGQRQEQNLLSLEGQVLSSAHQSDCTGAG